MDWIELGSELRRPDCTSVMYNILGSLGEEKILRECSQMQKARLSGVQFNLYAKRLCLRKVAQIVYAPKNFSVELVYDNYLGE